MTHDYIINEDDGGIIVKEGLYFDMPFSDYLRIKALSNSGIKDCMSSFNMFWNKSWMNKSKPPREEKAHNVTGEAYHCRILEGKEKFYSLYAYEFDASEYPDAIGKTDQLKDYLRDAKNNGHDVKLTGNKPELIDRCLEIDPDLQIIDNLKQKYEMNHSGKIFLSGDLVNEIEKAGKICEMHPDAKLIFSGGYPEVTCVFRDKKYGILHKCRFDYLKTKCHGELKTFDNTYGRDIDRVPANETAKYKYHIQYALYIEAAAYARQFAKEGRVFGEVSKDWLEKFSAYKEEHKAVCVFLQKDISDIRGKIFGNSLTMDCAKNRIDEIRDGFNVRMERHGEDTPWIDFVPFGDFYDEEFPIYMTE